ncbi:rho GTPase-activating protein 15-like isoform X8 [Mizuhopecten yessoensis]|uniref:rho GTPase-activating protein 15-like isoform X8 n=1 Tax=Mizuhopecten yessoensis TaxID=6573 RepID=UPI000B459910|nr:rho GTPase-activating protein 15-like isoform X8 [Mizuhopecten yessoensis]
MGDNSDHDGSDEEDYIGFGFATRKLAALYDYTYVDDSGKTVHMTKGEEYHLLEKSNDWWEVFRAGDSTDLSFYVPANYVKFVDDSESKAKTKQTSDSDFEGDPGSEMSSLGLDTRSISPSLKNGVSNADDTEGNHKPDKAMDIYANSNVSTFMTNNNVDVSSKNGSITVRPGMYRRSLSTDDGGDYMNLETLREQAGLPSAPRPPLQDGESIYANVQELNIEPQVKFTLTAPSQSPPVSPEEPPIPDEKNCPFLRTLLNVWEMYLDPITKRSFYINKETNEKTWKPPRYPKKSRSVRDTASSHYNSQLREKVELPKSAPVSVRVERSSIPDGWTVETTEGNQYFINKRTQEKELEKKVFHPGTSNQGQEKICGMLKKRMIVELGKQVKKSFSPSFVKLLGTNLVFYKNRQASTQQGSKHGKPEFMEPLQGAHIDKYPHKRHLNVLVLSTCNKNQYQLQLEDEIDMQKWLSTLELTIKELGPCMVDQQLLVLPGNSDSLKKTPSFKQKNRKPSEKEETPEEEKSRFKSIFERWMKDPQRPTKKQLEDKGIIEYNVFGGSLKQVCEKDKAKVPKFVQRCIAAIEKRGLDQDGLYRISGNMAQITKLRSMTNMDLLALMGESTDKFDYDLDNPDLWDIHVLAGALKLFFRELKEPLFALAQFDKFILAIGKKSRLDKLKGLKEQVNALPKYNYETLKFLCGHLIRVADRQSVNKMSFHNLAIVYGPTLMWKEMDTNFMAHMVLQSQIVEFVLLEYKNIFK